MSIAEKLITIAENEPKVFDAGKSKGYGSGFEDGKTQEWSDFWDSYQENGNRTNYKQVFCGPGWNDETWSPKYDIIPIGDAYCMCWRSNIANVHGILERNAIRFDTSNVTNAQMMLMEMYKATHFPTIDLSNATNCSDAVSVNTALKKIDKLIFSTSTNCSSGNSMFRSNLKLTSVGFEGTLASDGLNAQWCPFDKPTIISLINILSADTTGLTVTLNKSAVNKAFETSSGANDGSTSAEWLTLVATKPNWTMSLV